MVILLFVSFFNISYKDTSFKVRDIVNPLNFPELISDMISTFPESASHDIKIISWSSRVSPIICIFGNIDALPY